MLDLNAAFGARKLAYTNARREPVFSEERVVRRRPSLWLLVAAGSLTSIGLQAAMDPMVPVEMSPRHPDISRGVTELIEQWHYSHLPLDNTMSSAILDQYLDILDGNRVYFLASDVAEFGNYRYVLDESAREGNLNPAFSIFNRFRSRVSQRVNYALSLLEAEMEPDFTIDEDYRWDRTELGWPTTEDEMREIWRLRVKNDALTLVMAGETWPEVTETLRERPDGEAILFDYSNRLSDRWFDYESGRWSPEAPEPPPPGARYHGAR